MASDEFSEEEVFLVVDTPVLVSSITVVKVHFYRTY